MHQTTLSSRYGIIASTTTVRPTTSIPRYRRVDQPRIDLPQLLVSKPKLFRLPRYKVVYKDIGSSREVIQDVQSGLFLQIKCDAALVAIDGGEVVGYWCICRPAGDFPFYLPVAGVVSNAALLDFENVGAIVCEDLGAEGVGEDARDIEDAKTVQ